MRRTILASITIALFAASLPVFAQAAEDADDIVRLPGAGLVKADARFGLAHERLVPGGGLLASFDSNRDGLITQAELTSGATRAFAAADMNADGELTALEQQAWAGGLPTRDDSLANPVRFDPNLDRIVTIDEFTAVIAGLAASYARLDGAIEIASLAAPEKRPDPRAFTQVAPRGQPERR